MFFVDAAQHLFREIDEVIAGIDEQVLTGYPEFQQYQKALARRGGLLEARDMIRAKLSSADKQGLNV